VFDEDFDEFVTEEEHDPDKGLISPKKHRELKENYLEAMKQLQEERDRMKASHADLKELRLENDFLKDKKQNPLSPKEAKELDYQLSPDETQELIEENHTLREKMRIVLESQANISKLVRENETLKKKVEVLKEEQESHENKRDDLKQEVKVITEKLVIREKGGMDVSSPTHKSLQKALERTNEQLRKVVGGIHLVQEEHGRAMNDIDHRTKLIQEAQEHINRMPRSIGVHTGDKNGRVVVTKVRDQLSDLEKEDIIFKIDDVEIQSNEQMTEELQLKDIGATIKVDIIRKEEDMPIYVAVGTWAKNEFAENQRKAWGLVTSHDITLKEEFGSEEEEEEEERNGKDAFGSDDEFAELKDLGGTGIQETEFVSSLDREQEVNQTEQDLSSLDRKQCENLLDEVVPEDSVPAAGTASSSARQSRVIVL